MTSQPRIDQQKQTIDIVIVTYNGRKVLGACLDSVRVAQNDDLTLRTIVVDNQSTDGTTDWLASEYPDVSVIESGSNAGFSVANNLALRQTQTEFVLVLNPDTVLGPDVLPHLLDVANSDENIGMIGCRLEQLDGTFDHAAKRGFPSYRDALRYFTKGLKLQSGSNYLAAKVDERGVGVVDAINGAFMLVRSEAIKDVGLFDERYWMYGEDLDWCRRFQAAGWKVYYDGRVTAIHIKSGLTGKLRSLKLNWHFHKSMAIFYRTYDAGQNILIDCIVYLGICARMVYFGFKYLGVHAGSSASRTVRKLQG
jgi:N-acetylglucosaminyl-diphospho-decaprenol L-rhamnosyltransferase